MAWLYHPQRLRDILETAGFDVDITAAVLDGGGSLSARRQRGEQAIVISIDSGGRFLMTLTSIVESPPPRTAAVAGIQVRIVPELTRSTMISGHLPSVDHLKPLLDALPALAARPAEWPNAAEIPSATPALHGAVPPPVSERS